jgi:hypothetical protein
MLVFGCIVGSKPVVWTADPDVFRVTSYECPEFLKDIEAVR